MQDERDDEGRIQNKLLCYNKGCGKSFFGDDNEEDSCTYHPGTPFFHDAYKGWTCCNKKCTDFTEFLNFKGCTRGFHNNVKPPEPEKPPVDESSAEIVTKYRAPAAPNPQRMERPAYDTPMVPLEATVSDTLLQQVTSLVGGCSKETAGAVAIGTTCKNGGCKASYNGDDCDSRCLFHPGCPIFHEGLKFWSCCQRRTTDFQSFLDQEGCKTGVHLWLKERGEGQQQVSCRMDWHQTASNVVVSVFAKKYDPKRSTIQLSPVRLSVQLYFPEEDSCYFLDIELRGMVDVGLSSVQMLPTKVEVKLRKSEPGSWPKLDFPRPVLAKPAVPRQPSVEKLSASDLEPVDLSDL